MTTESVDPGSYDAILPLVEDVQADGDWLKCIFRCPVGGARIEAQVRLESRAQTEPASDGSMRLRVANVLRGAFANDSRQPRDAGKRARLLSQAEMQRAVQRAFRSVQTRFVWEAGKRWISAEAAGYVLPDFVQLLKSAPVIHAADRAVLARMLTEVAGVAGRPKEDATAAATFLRTHLPPEAGEIGELAQLPPLALEELGACSPGMVRETILMLAWGVVLVVEEPTAEQVRRLAHFARGLGIVPARASEVKQHAQTYLVDQALERAYAADEDSAARYVAAMKLAHRLGLSYDDAERVDQRLRKRLGLS